MLPPSDLDCLGDGAFNMALDQVLFESFEGQIPCLRFYCFEHATVSVPLRFNGAQISTEQLKKHGVRICKRISGGKYLLHQLGLTYAILIPKNHGYIRGLDIKSSYRKLSLPILKALRNFDRTVDFIKCERAPADNYDCSLESEVESIGLNGAKFVGSAQKRSRDVVLQHGEIQLCSSALGLGQLLSQHNPNSSKGLDKVCLDSISDDDNFLVWQERKPNSELSLTRESVARKILQEFEKVFGKSYSFQLESTFINHAMERRKDFQLNTLESKNFQPRQLCWRQSG